MPTTAVVTIVQGRHRHLRRQLTSVDTAATSGVVCHVLVAMGDDAIADLVAEHESANEVPTTVDRVVVRCPVPPDGELPLAAARNLGAATGLERGADLLVFLDVDCLAHRELLVDYRAAAAGSAGMPAPVLWCGQVSYLPPLPDGVDDYPSDGLERWAAPHPARPVLSSGDTRFSPDVRLFWSLNFAVTADDWHTSGGFHPGYRGYGGEDTDFARGIAALGGGLGWIGGAGAFHQYHPTSSPPWQHLTAIVRNAHLFRDRWGRFPMEGWLEAFAQAGAVDYRPDDGVLELLADPTPPAVPH